jgi:hypothetical protein
MLKRDDQVTVSLNGWVRLLGLIGIPGAISLYLVWWLTWWLGAKLDRMIEDRRTAKPEGRDRRGSRTPMSGGGSAQPSDSGWRRRRRIDA